MLALNSTSEDPLLLLQKKEGASVREWVCVCKLNRGRRKVYGGGWILDEWNVQDPTATWANQLTSTIPAGCQLACFPCECSWYREPAGLIREWVESTVGRRPEKRRGGSDTEAGFTGWWPLIIYHWPNQSRAAARTHSQSAPRSDRQRVRHREGREVFLFEEQHSSSSLIFAEDVPGENRWTRWTTAQLIRRLRP